MAFFLPATILAVLFPRTAARQARGEDTADIIGRSLWVTAGFGAVLALFYAMTGRGLVHTSFGADFADGGELLVPFTISMTLFALVHVLVGFHLSRDERRYAWIVAGAVPGQLLLLAIVPGSVRQVIWVDVLIGIALLASHELFVESSVPALRAGFGRLPVAERIRRSHVVEGVLVAVGATAFVCALFWPLLSQLGTDAIGGDGSDAAGTIGWLWRLQDEGYHLFGTTVHVLTGAPIGWEESNGLNLQWLLAYYPAYLGAKVVGEVAAYNLVVLTGYVLSGVTMYVLARYLRCSRLVAAWAGLVFIVFPWHLERAEHASLVHLEILVLLLLALVATAEKPVALRFLLIGLATLAGWLTSGYFGVMAVIGACAFALAAAALGGGSNRLRLVIGTTVSALAATAVLGIGATSSGVGTGAGLNREVEDLSVYGLRPTELVVPPADNLVAGNWLESFHVGRLHGSTALETSNYVGLLTIVLALAWLAVAWRRRANLDRRLRLATAGLAGVLLAALAFSAPSPVGVFGHLFSWGPSRVLWETRPRISRAVSLDNPHRLRARSPRSARPPSRGIRTEPEGWLTERGSARAGPAGRGRDGRFLRRARHRPERALAAHSPGSARVRSPVPLARRTCGRLPAGPAHLLLPLAASHGRPLVNGPGEGSFADRVRLTLVDPGAPGTAARLALLGVPTIVTWQDALDYETQSAPDVPNASWGPGYELVERFPDGSSVWRVTAAPAPALVTFAAGFGEPIAPTPGQEYAPVGLVGYPLDSRSGRGVVELSAREPGVIRLVLDAVPAQRTRALTLIGSDSERRFQLNGRTTVSTLVEIPRGSSQLILQTSPAPATAVPAVVLFAPRTERATGPAELRARPAPAVNWP